MLLIDIIGTIDDLIELNLKRVSLLYETGEFIYNTSKSKLLKLVDFAKINIDKQNADFSKPSGKFNYYTCSAEINKCDEYAFDGRNILISGNGVINVNHDSGKINAYQRVYVIKPNGNDDYGLVYFASKSNINSILSKSVGSIIKYITLGDVQNILIKDLGTTERNMLSDLLIQIDEIKVVTLNFN